MLVWLLIIAGVVILDQASKAWVMYGLGLDEIGESIPIIDGVFNFTCVKNTGAAFGMLGGENQRWIFIVISTLGILALCVYLWKFRPQSKWACTALAMIIGGGIGNMIDRCFRVGDVYGVERHYVYDFLDFCAFPDLWKWTFNVADAFVCVGAGILMVWCVASLIDETKKEKQAKLAAANCADASAAESDEEIAEQAAEDSMENSTENSTENSAENNTDET